MSLLSQSRRIARSADEVASVVAARPALWLGPFVRIACEAGERAAARAAGATDAPAASPVVVASIDGPVADDDAGTDELVLPVRWRSGGYRWILPAFEGGLVVRRTGAETEVSIRGAWAAAPEAGPPEGGFARAIGASTCISAFLDTLRDALEAQVRTTA